MEPSVTLYSSIILLGAAHGLFLALALVNVKGGNAIAHCLLAVLTLLFAVDLGVGLSRTIALSGPVSEAVFRRHSYYFSVWPADVPLCQGAHLKGWVSVFAQDMGALSAVCHEHCSDYSFLYSARQPGHRADLF